MKIHRLSIAYCIACVLFSCSNEKPLVIQENLKLAGDNCKELKKAINHYRKEQDSLKLEAVYFLIKNMQYHGYYEIEDERKYDVLFDSIGNYYPERESNDEFFNFILRSRLVDNMVNEYLLANSIGSYRGEYHSDLQSLNADFLIENI